MVKCLITFLLWEIFVYGLNYPFQVVGGTAETNGQLMRGDQIMKVNDQDLSEAKQDQAVAVLKTASGVVQIRVRRYKSIVASSSS